VADPFTLLTQFRDLERYDTLFSSRWTTEERKRREGERPSAGSSKASNSVELAWLLSFFSGRSATLKG